MRRMRAWRARYSASRQPGERLRIVVHMYCVRAPSSASSCISFCKRIFAHFIGVDTHAAPRVIRFGSLVEAVDLASQQTAGFQHPIAPRADTASRHRGSGCAGTRRTSTPDRRTHRRTERDRRRWSRADARAGYPQILARAGDHFIRYVHTVNLTEMTRHRLHQTARSATDLKRSPRPPVRSRRETPQLPFETRYDFPRRLEELLVILLTAAERDIEMRVLASPLIPIAAACVR